MVPAPSLNFKPQSVYGPTTADTKGIWAQRTCKLRISTPPFLNSKQRSNSRLRMQPCTTILARAQAERQIAGSHGRDAQGRGVGPRASGRALHARSDALAARGF